MQASTKQERSPRTVDTNAASPFGVMMAYLEKSPIVQAFIRDLTHMLHDQSLSAQDRCWAEKSLQDALFRHRARPAAKRRRTGATDEKAKPPGLREAHQRLEEEERVFAKNLARLLKAKDISQAELAKRVGVGSSAISMMLGRHCRPQKRTVEKIARALGVELRELWPD